MDDAQREDVIRNREVQRAGVAPQYHSQPVLDHKSHVLEIESLIRQSIKKLGFFACWRRAAGRTKGLARLTALNTLQEKLA